MARDRQKAKQRKAKKLAQEQKHEQRSADKAQRSEQRSEQREQRLEEIEQEGVGRQSMAHTGTAAEVELEQARMDADLKEASEADKTEASGGAATQAGKEVEEQPHVQESKRQRRQRERAEEKTRSASKKTARGRRGDGGGQAKRDKKTKKPRERGRVTGFFAQVWAELKRVQWPTRDQVLQATGVVAGFCLVAGLYLAFWDYVWSQLVDRLF
jgi:preprotein translocase subunit SecE